MAPIDELDPARLDALFASTGDEASRIARNAVTSTETDVACLDRAKVVGTPTVMSHRLDQWKATSQKKSGRCWLFFSLNLLRDTTRGRIGMRDFESPQNYVSFFNKLERANYFLRDMVACASEPVDSHLVQLLSPEVLGDGGQWDMTVSLYQKHGLAPKEATPETQSSSNTSWTNVYLQVLLHRSALEVRELLASGASPRGVEALIFTVSDAIWRILVIRLGELPCSFDWEWRDDAGEFHRDGTVIPREFLDRYVGVDLSEYVYLVDDPRRAHAKGQALTVEYLGNVIGRRQICYINTEMATIKKIASRMIARGEPVWLGADVSQQSECDLGLLVEELHDYLGLFGIDLKIMKEQRVLSGESAMNHAMLFTGVDIDEDGHPCRQRVENSWGEDVGEKGFFTMDDAWFSEYVFEIVVKISELLDELRPAVTSEPLVLPTWDPMGIPA